MEATGSLPETLLIDDADLVLLVGNLLDNAINAAPPGKSQQERSCKINCVNSLAKKEQRS